MTVVHNGGHEPGAHQLKRIQRELHELDANIRSLMTKDVPSVELNRRLLLTQANERRFARIVAQAAASLSWRTASPQPPHPADKYNPSVVAASSSTPANSSKHGYKQMSLDDKMVATIALSPGDKRTNGALLATTDSKNSNATSHGNHWGISDRHSRFLSVNGSSPGAVWRASEGQGNEGRARRTHIMTVRAPNIDRAAQAHTGDDPDQLLADASVGSAAPGYGFHPLLANDSDGAALQALLLASSLSTSAASREAGHQSSSTRGDDNDMKDTHKFYCPEIPPSLGKSPPYLSPSQSLDYYCGQLGQATEHPLKPRHLSSPYPSYSLPTHTKLFTFLAHPDNIFIVHRL